MGYDWPIIEDRLATLARWLDLPQPSGQVLIEWTLTLRREIGIPHTLAELGVSEERIDDLMGRMTLEEMVYQMGAIIRWGKDADYLTDKKGRFVPAKARRVIGKRNISQICCIVRPLRPREGARLANDIQKFAARDTRLGIPIIIHDEALHGLMARGSTSFPQCRSSSSPRDASSTIPARSHAGSMRNGPRHGASCSLRSLRSTSSRP